MHYRVQVTIRRRILKPEVIDFIAKADQTYQLTQRERIALGLLAQHDDLTARELVKALELPSVEALQPWLKRQQLANFIWSVDDLLRGPLSAAAEYERVMWPLPVLRRLDAVLAPTGLYYSSPSFAEIDLHPSRVGNTP